MQGIVYTETLVHAPPVQFEADAPYQIAIVDLADGRRVTGRICTSAGPGSRVQIGDAVEQLEERDGVPWFTAIG